MKRMMMGPLGLLLLSVAATSVAATGCGGGGGSKEGPKTASGAGGDDGDTSSEGGGGKSGPKIDPEASDAFKGATAAFKAHEDARDWDDASCKKVADQFLAAGKAQKGDLASAHYDAGVTWMKCANDEAADAEFDKAQGLAPEMHQVAMQKAMLKYRKGDVASISDAIDAIFSRGIDPDGAKNVEAFVNLGMLYRERWNRDNGNPAVRKKDVYGSTVLEDDLARSQYWLQNALAINDAFMPAYNQLALYYLDKARAVASKTKGGAAKGKEEKKMRADAQTLALGLLVADEASRRDDKYPAIWNTKGLILLEMGRTAQATQAFKKATDNDAKFFEAWMNYAAINLNFRGYGAASEGYKAAMGINGKSYEAKLGYAVAQRGQLDFYLTAKQALDRKVGECQDPDKAGAPGCRDIAGASAKSTEFEGKFKGFYKAALDAYEAAIALDKDRAEAFFDRALLIEKYKQKATEVTTQAAYEEAQKLYEEIVTKFGGNPKYEKLVADSKARGEEARKSAEFEAKATAAPPPAPTPAPAASAAPAAAPAPAGSAAPAGDPK